MTPPLYTTVEAASLPFRLEPGDGVVSLGSCFADELASRLLDGGFSVEANPFGTLYNPASVASALERLVEGRPLADADLVEHGGLWHSWHHHGSFSRPTADECLEACNSRLARARAALASARLLVLTFGTAWVFETVADGTTTSYSGVVANCHKLPPSVFTRRRMQVAEVVVLWQPLLLRLAAFNPALEVVFTVSPIRHMADGAHGNQLSKATLLLAVDGLLRQAGLKAHYFPAYEIVLDELRDYRFYAADMTHPSQLAADIVCDRFEQATMSPSTRQLVHNNRKQSLRQRHVPLRRG